MLRLRSNNNTSSTPFPGASKSAVSKPIFQSSASSFWYPLTFPKPTLRSCCKRRGSYFGGSNNQTPASETRCLPNNAIILGTLLLVTIVEFLYLIFIGGFDDGDQVSTNWNVHFPTGTNLHGQGSVRGNSYLSDNTGGPSIDDFYQRPHISGTPVPLIVGGSDGSGTRAVVQLLEDLGVQMVVEDKGTSDVHAKDLSGGEGWPGLVSKVLRLTHSAVYELKDLPATLTGIACSELGSLLKNIEVAAGVLKAVKGGTGSTTNISFGFKAPVSILLLPFFRKQIPAFKVLHIVRDGRDIAFSDNHSPVNKFYDIFYPKSSPQRARALLVNQDIGFDAMNQVKAMQLWNDWNMQVYEYGRRLADGKTLDILVMRSEDLLTDKYHALLKLADFVGSSKTPKELCCMSRRGLTDFGTSQGKSNLDERHFFDPADFDAIEGRFQAFAPKAKHGAEIASWEDIREKMVEQHRNDHVPRRLLGEPNHDYAHYDVNGVEGAEKIRRRLASVVSKVQPGQNLRDSKDMDFSLLARFYNRKNQKPKEVRERYGKWVERLDGNPILSERLHQEGKDALRSFGYEPRRTFMDMKDGSPGCDETIVCTTRMV